MNQYRDLFYQLTPFAPGGHHRFGMNFEMTPIVACGPVFGPGILLILAAVFVPMGLAGFNLALTALKCRTPRSVFSNIAILAGYGGFLLIAKNAPHSQALEQSFLFGGPILMGSQFVYLVSRSRNRGLATVEAS